MNTGHIHYPWFVKKDLDGFFGLAIDNLIQLILIAGFCKILCGMPDVLVFGRILPGAAISILFGNFYYSYQARKLAIKTGRDDVTALPYGINTVSLFAYIFFVMAPAYHHTKDPYLAWRLGLIACLFSGIIEIIGAFVGERLRRITPRAALLSSLAGIAITFISMDFVFKIFNKPLIAMLPLAFILVQYFSKIRLPFGIPGGLVAVASGTILAWSLGYMGDWSANANGPVFQFSPPRPIDMSVFKMLWSADVLQYLSVCIPMGIFNVVGSLQNIESAEAGGDKYETFPSLSVNGIGTILGFFLGSCFPTTIYIGHPGWKAIGARTGYSALNGLFITFICLTGTVTTILRIVPIEAGIGILLWIGIVIVAQAFQETPRHHAPAVAIGFFPALAAWGLLLVETTLRTAGTTLFLTGKKAFGEGLAIHGMISFERGFIFTAMIFSSIAVFLIEKKFLNACLWSLGAAALAFVGIIHGYKITPDGVVSAFGFGVATDFAIGYCSFAVLFICIHFYRNYKES